ncbi:hypothetical protein AGMMS50267_14480 [Spirochaetia bacterium]|nr:hypothetical protein AGMMS50267_14480 [Spirochaetia bacterium]
MGTISLASGLHIHKNLTIQGNGAAITRDASWTTIDGDSQLLGIGTGTTVNISRVHFKDGRAWTRGAAIWVSSLATLNLESCIFSGNQTSSTIAEGGAIYSTGTLTVKGCTFYGNSSGGSGGAIYHDYGTLTLTGNLFYRNTNRYASSVVYWAGFGSVKSGGCNVVDVPVGIGRPPWNAAGDKFIGALPVSPETFRLLSWRGAANVITTLPVDYPTVDFYGDAITNGAAAGAVQATASGYFLDMTVNNSAFGSASVSSAPDADGLYTGAVTFTAAPVAGCEFAYWLVNGTNTGSANPLTLTLPAHTSVRVVFSRPVAITSLSDAASSAATPGTLRYALTNAQEGDVLQFSGVTAGTSVVALTGALPPITRSITIEGNGVTLTRSASWTAVDAASQLLYGSGTVNISRVHFKGGQATAYGAAIRFTGGTLNLESCIFSGNQTSDTGGSYGGAIFSYGTLTVKGCTFYGNSASGRGGAIYSGETLTLTGNLFYRNTAGIAGPVVYKTGAAVTSGGGNVVDAAPGTGDTQSGWTAAAGDNTISVLPISSESFRLLSGSEAANVITPLPAGYPTADFYGNAITNGAAAGAVQAVASGGGYYLDLSVNDRALGSVAVSPPPSEDGLVTGSFTLTAAGNELAYWLVNGTNAGSANPLTLTLTAHTTVRAVFTRMVTSLSDAAGSDTTAGTLRHALTNAEDGDIIRFSGVTAGTSVVALTGRLPDITKSITIEGSGVTLTRSASWTTVDVSSQLLYGSGMTVNISRVHFKDGRATAYGAAIRFTGGTLNLESCIFSGNQTSGSYGGAIYSNGTLTVKGCTFYGNSGRNGGAIYNHNGTLTLTGNLFYGNTAGTAIGPVVYGNGTVTSGGCNVADAVPGTGDTQSGWTAATGDTTISAPAISPASFRLLSGSGAANVITTLPAGYPTADFYGNAITNGAASGAVQAASGGGYYLGLSVNYSALGSVTASPPPDAEELVSGSVTLTAAPTGAGSSFEYWLVNGTNAGSANPLTLTMTAHTTVRAVFNHEVLVTSLSDAAGSDTTAGTLRHALANVQDGDTIRFSGITAGTSVIELTSRLPSITKSITIEGGGVTITRAASWIATSVTSQLLLIGSNITVNINRVHFKDGRATDFGAAIMFTGGTLNLESCIFSGNQTSGAYAEGGAIYSIGTLTVNGCTFYGNSSGNYGGAIYNNGTLTLTGNLFYGNTAGTAGPVVYNDYGTVTSGGCNVADAAPGTGDTQSGWTAVTGDTLFTTLGISGNPLNTGTFAPLSAALNIVPSGLAGFLLTDFYGNTRTFPGAPGAVQ